MVREGARVLVNDLDTTTLGHIAEEIGAVAFASDAASERGVAHRQSRPRRPWRP